VRSCPWGDLHCSITSQSYHCMPGSRALCDPVAVGAEFSADDDIAALRAVALQVADDINEQFGIRHSRIPE
jgi:hypothetical protein